MSKLNFKLITVAYEEASVCMIGILMLQHEVHVVYFEDIPSPP